MQELIKITERQGQRVVSARDLHKFLGSKKDFSNWIKHRITKYGLIENTDFTRLTQKGELENQVVRIEYALTTDAAKELAMVEGNAKGKQARRYFIECEKIAKTKSIALPTPRQLAHAILQLEDTKDRLEAFVEVQAEQIKKLEEKAEYASTVLQSSDTYNINLIAKELGMSAVTLNKELQSRGIQYIQRSGDFFGKSTWVLYHQYQNKGYTKTKTHTYTGKDGEVRSSMRTVWTEAGRMFIHSIINPKKLN